MPRCQGPAASGTRPAPTAQRQLHHPADTGTFPQVPAAAIGTLLASFAYVFLLIAALVIVNIALTRRTREEREAERVRRRQRKPS
jgi:membrane protein implicated in regulation of membrane protease activity